MEEPYPNWNSLPAEILLNILQIAEEHQSEAKLCNYALVCKTWLYPARSVLYSNVCIDNLPQLKMFSNTVEHNNTLGEMVKSFSLYICKREDVNYNQETAKVEILDLFTNLISGNLPNLERINHCDTIFYSPILKALTSSHLKRMRVLLEPPGPYTDKSEVESYVKCALLIKDRLENITILNDNRYAQNEESSVVEKLPYYRLYDNLHQFEKLTEIHIGRETSKEVQALEYVVKCCKSLKSITFYFTPPDKDTDTPSQSRNVPVNAISDITPKPQIKELNCRLNASSGHEILLYVINKFPQLSELRLGMVDNGPDKLNEYILTQLLHYLSKIESYSARDLTVNLNTFSAAVASYWNAASRPGNEYVRICYSYWFRNREHRIILSKIFDDPKSGYTSFTFPLSNLGNIEWKHTDFLQQSGSYIREIQFDIGVANLINLPDNWELPENFLLVILKHCPDLENLYLVNGVLKQPPYTTIDISTKFSLEELYMNSCELYSGMLEQASLILHKVKQLCLGQLWYHTNNDGTRSSDTRRPDFEIIMPHTEIDIIAFEGMSRDATVHMSVRAFNKESHHCYRWNSTLKEFVILSKEEYLCVNDGKLFYICCANKPALRVQRQKWLPLW